MRGETTNPFKKATIKDVASRAGVSVTTVSHFLSGRLSVCSVETGNRIKEAVEALYYTPSAFGRGLRGSKTKTIGVCAINPEEIFSNGANDSFGLQGIRNPGTPFFERLWRGLIEQADREDYQLLLYPSSVRKEEGQLDHFHNGSSDGVIFLTPSTDARPELLARAGFPTVTFGQPISDETCVSRVFSEEFQIVDLALTHLWGLGHRRIAHIAGPIETFEVPGQPTHPVSRIALGRFEAYRSWISRWSEFDPDLVGYARIWDTTFVHEAVHRLLALAEPPTAIFCANDVIAKRALEVLQESGKRVPVDVSVVGVDNTAECQYTSPTLTSVDVEVEELGRQAVLTLATLIQAEKSIRMDRSIRAAELFVRESTGPVSKT